MKRVVFTKLVVKKGRIPKIFLSTFIISIKDIGILSKVCVCVWGGGGGEGGCEWHFIVLRECIGTLIFCILHKKGAPMHAIHINPTQTLRPNVVYFVYILCLIGSEFSKHTYTLWPCKKHYINNNDFKRQENCMCLINISSKKVNEYKSAT